MANTLRFKRGLASGIPTALAGEPLFTTDTFDLYIGNGSGNTRFQKYIASGATTQILRGDGSLYTFPLAISSPSAGQVLKYNGTSWVNDSDSGITGSGTTNEIAYFTGATTLGSLTTATYPSLTELSYVKGVTSAIQTQINAKFTLPSLTSGSVLFSNGTTIAQDNANLFWDNTNDRLGIGTVIPQSKLQVRNGDFGIYNGTTGSLGGQIYLGDINFDNSSYWNSAPGIGAVYSASSGVASDLGFYTYAGSANARTERIRIFYTGNVAVGGTFSSDSGEKLQVTGTMKVTGATALFTTTITSTTNVEWTNSLNVSGGANGDNSGTRAYFRPSGTFGAAIYGGRWSSTDRGARLVGISSGSVENTYIHLNGESSIMQLATAATVRATIDASGNLGLGVTPSAWYTPATSVLQVRHSSFYSQADGGNYYTFIGNNYFQDSGTFFKYINTGSAVQYRQFNGQHIWYNAPSGTANATITFTQAMTLDASGNLGVGTASPSVRLHLSNNTHNYVFFDSSVANVQTAFLIRNSGTEKFTLSWEDGTRGNYGILKSATQTLFLQGSTEAARFTSLANLHIGTFSSDSGEKLQVTGTAKITGITTFGSTGGSGLRVYGASGTNQWDMYLNGANIRFSDNTGTGSFVVDRPATFSSSVTAASGIFTGNLTVDTNTLFVDATNNRVGIGTASPAAAIHVIGTESRFGGVASGFISLYNANNRSGYLQANQAVDFRIASDNDPMTFYVGGSERARITTLGNLHLGTYTSDSGEKLQVNGTAKITGATTVNAAFRVDNNGYVQIVNNANAGLYLNNGTSQWQVYNNTSSNLIVNNGAGSTVLTLDYLTGAATFSSSLTVTGNLTVDTNTLFVDATNNRVGIGTASPSSRFEVNGDTNFKVASGNVGYSLISGADSFSFYFNDADNTYRVYTSNGAADRFIYTDTGNFGIGMTPSYKLDVSGSARVSDAIAIGTTPDTNNPFKILKNINATVGIKFENTNTSSLAFSAVQLGTDVSGGTKFTNLVYASSGVTASGVYNPDGTSLINNGNGGLNFLGNPIRMYTGGSNGVLRWDISNEGIIQYNATSPTTSATDAYKQYSADVTAGNAAPHFRTENGAVIKLYQETTAVGNSTISIGGGNAVLDDTEFDGYTLRQIVKALRNQGILA